MIKKAVIFLHFSLSTISLGAKGEP